MPGRVELGRYIDGSVVFYPSKAKAEWEFRWLLQSLLVLMPCPKHEEYLDFLLLHGIRHIVCFAPESRPADIARRSEFILLEIPVEEFSAPTLNQTREFIQFCEQYQRFRATVSDDKNSVPIALHCRQGLGRTGVFAACYLVRYFGLTAAMAMLQVRKVRPHSVETVAQERSVSEYYDFLCSNPPEDDDCWKPSLLE